jgi:hypothetical protein
MPAFLDNLLIHPDGAINEAYLFAAAHRVARQRYGKGCTLADVAFYIEDLSGRALIMRARKLRELGLAGDPTVSVSPFGRQVEGVRMSAF